jgi:ubiquinone/menaquinone biosynthesis C-methylase UbiE
MNWAELFWGFLTVVLVADARRIRNRILAIPRIRPDEPKHDSSVQWVTAPGVTLDEATKLAAVAHMEAHNLAALDLVPARVSLAMAWSFGCHIDPVAHRGQATRPGDTGVHAFAAPALVLEGLGVDEAERDLGSFVSVAREVRRRVTGAHDLAISPTLRAHKSNPFFDGGALGVKLGGSLAPVAFGVPFAVFLILLGPVLAPWMGTVALLVHLSQQAMGVYGTGFDVRLPWLQGLVRIPVDLVQWSRLLSGRSVSREKIDALRPVYSELMAGGTEGFFDAPASRCPICDGGALTRGFTLPDLYQGKPGRFRVVRCRGCHTRFQNPRLSLEGLAFYYRDFYDGIGEDALDMVFGSTRDLYAARVALVGVHGEAKRWLDVGCGHGHLFGHVRSVLADTRLEGLDMGDGVDIALARGWIDQAHKGLFPEMAPGLKDRFDVVSMCHYLEHTLDIRQELAAAHTVLQGRGLLLIEVPDPESVFASVLGRWWMPWFQPQHIHFVTTITLASLLREAGFEPLEWHTGKANTANDLVLSFSNMVRQWAPSLDVPWRKPPSLLRRVGHVLVWIPGGIFVALGALADHALAPLARRAHHSSQFRVIARKR